MNEGYHLWLENEARGPFTVGQINGLWEAGNLNEESLVSSDNGENWHYLKDLWEELATKQKLPVPKIIYSPLPATGQKTKSKLCRILQIGAIALVIICTAAFGIYKYLDYNPEIVHNDYFDNSVWQAKAWFKDNLNDPSSLQILDWSSVEKRGDGYVVECRFRSKNTSGGYETQQYRFGFDKLGNVDMAGTPEELFKELDEDLQTMNAKKNESAVEAHMVRRGMTAQDVLRSLGEPSNIIDTAGRDPNSKGLWQYGDGRWVGIDWNNEVNSVSENLDYDKTNK